MRASMAVLSAALTIGAMAACDSSTAPAKCDIATTTASYASVPSATGTITNIGLVKGSRSSNVQIVSLGLSLTEVFTVNSETAVFERSGNAAPTPTSACRLSTGQVVEFPTSVNGSGFGDYINENGESPPLPLTVPQLVIVR
jgi:hypothetical protein